MSKTMVNIYLTDVEVEKLDRLRRATPDRPELSRNAYAAWLCSSKLAEVPDGDRPKPRKIVATPKDPLATPAAEAAPHEGTHLRAARIAAGLTHGALAAGVSSESAEVSRGQVQRAERAASLDGYPALRAWLLAQEAKS